MSCPAEKERSLSIASWEDSRLSIKSISSEARDSMTAVTPITYPMYGMSMERFLGMSPDIPLPPHQELLREGMLTRCGAQTQVIFVSHEWLSFNHFDPNGDQVRALQTIFRRLIAGELELYADPWYQLLVDEPPYLSGADCKELFSKMHVWLDWISIPQSKSYDPVPPAKLMAAVESIPGYVAEAELMLIIAPPAVHVDRGTLCDFSSWCERGWCITELQSALLSICETKVLLVTSGDSAPMWGSPYTVLQRTAGSGNFTCCQRNHEIDGHRIDCDKLKVHAVLSSMLKAKGCTC